MEILLQILGEIVAVAVGRDLNWRGWVVLVSVLAVGIAVAVLLSQADRTALGILVCAIIWILGIAGIRHFSR